MAAWDVSVIGPLNIDFLIIGEGPQDLSELPAWQGPAFMEMTAAGSVGYTVQDLARLGLHVQVASCVPDDGLGNFILDNLRQAGVAVKAVRQVPDTLAGIGAYLLLFGSRKRPLVYRMPSHDPWPSRFSDAEVDDLLDARLLHCGGYLHFQSMWHAQLVEIFQTARQKGLRTALDPQFPLIVLEPPWLDAYADLLPQVDLLLCDENEALQSTAATSLAEAAQRLQQAGAQRVVIKQGAAGATVYQPGETPLHQPAIHLGELVDSIGAGDAFDAAFLYGWLQDWKPKQCAAFAAVAAGKTVTGVGGSQTMPGIAEITAILTAQDL